MGGTDGGRWDDDQLLALVAEVLDGKAPSGTSAPPEAPAELSLKDVVAAGRAAFCWLDVVVSLRNASDTRRPSREPRPSMRAPLAWPPLEQIDATDGR